MQKVVFRADASISIGGGHVMRCLALADVLSEHGWECNFASNIQAAEIVPSLNRGKHGLLELDETEYDKPEALCRNWPDGINLLIVDHYGLGIEFETGCRSWAQKIMAIDDVPNRKHDCDVLLDQTVGRKHEEYDTVVKEGVLRLIGSKYALVRSDFQSRRQFSLARRAVPDLKRGVLCFGMVDSVNATTRALLGLEQSSLDVSVDVIVGDGAPHLRSIEAVLSASRLAARLHVDSTQIAALMTNADLALGTAGSTSWERCCLGLPSIVVVVADNQVRIATELVMARAAISLGCINSLQASNFADVLQALAENVDDLSNFSRNAAMVCDGKGARRVAQILLQ